MFSIEERYAFLLRRLTLSKLDFWEGDGLIITLRSSFPLYFQISKEDQEVLSNGDNYAALNLAIEKAMKEEHDY